MADTRAHQLRPSWIEAQRHDTQGLPVKLEPGEKRECVACGQPLIGALTRDGKVAPITEYVQVEGNVLIFRAAGKIECRTFAGETLDKLRAETVPLRLNHFADCPKAEQFEGKSERV